MGKVASTLWQGRFILNNKRTTFFAKKKIYIYTFSWWKPPTNENMTHSGRRANESSSRRLVYTCWNSFSTTTIITSCNDVFSTPVFLVEHERPRALALFCHFSGKLATGGCDFLTLVLYMAYGHHHQHTLFSSFGFSRSVSSQNPIFSLTLLCINTTLRHSAMSWGNCWIFLYR
jgi:hypothetical protein